MSDRLADSAVVPAPRGRITRVSATYLVNTATGLAYTIHGLAAMRRYGCPQQVEELTGALAVACEQVLAARPASSPAGLPAGTVRVVLDSSAAQAAGAPCRVLLDAVRDVLDCPPPADPAGEQLFLRLRAERARLVVAALGPVLSGRGPGLAGAREAAAVLRAGATACPADIYRPSALSL
jgi:hypothetical protein